MSRSLRFQRSWIAIGMALTSAVVALSLIAVGQAVPVAGGDKVSHAAVRNMMCCTVAGQGAGVAAAIAVKTGRRVGDVDITAVQGELERQEVRLW